jgi:hypothetical protein
MSRLRVEREAEEYAREWTTNEEKRKAFIAGAVWVAREFWRLDDRGPMLEAMASKSIKDYLDELTLKDIRKVLKHLLAYEKEDRHE